ncbi:DUF6165 family protein [Hwanghaeella sp.]|uniref:DUF6165 family protein n=1 Tax=Hwanghaeella sp. TaxID=2605943 RepID=UPI003CCC1834
MSVMVPVSWGELIDKITILEIKQQKLADPAALDNVRRELALLAAVRDEARPLPAGVAQATDALREVNEALWRIEDDIRDCERDKNFNKTFIELARAVYKTNDRRAALKREINTLMNSDIYEEKSYTPYD